MGVGGYRGDRAPQTCCRWGQRMDVRDDLLWRLTMIILIDTLRMEHPSLISAGIAVGIACWVGAGSLPGVRGQRVDQKGGGLDAC